MNIKTKSKAKNYILLNPLLRRIAFLVLSLPPIVNNPIYRYVHQKQVNHVVKVFSGKPQIVQLEVANICNLRCANCPNKDMLRERGFMVKETYEKVIDECVEQGINDMYLSGMGEPTLHKSLTDIVTYAKASGIRVLVLVTNATLLTPQLSEGLIKGKLDRLYVSIDAATDKTYSKMRPPSKLGMVEKNLKNFIKLRNEMKSTKPQVAVRFTKKPENAGEIHLFKRKWEGLADEVHIVPAHNWGGAIAGEKSEWQGSIKREPCTMIFRFMNVLWNGAVSLCCIDSEGGLLLGNIKEASIKEIWQSKRLQEIRRIHLDGNFDKIPLCDSCTFRDVWWLY